MESNQQTRELIRVQNTHARCELPQATQVFVVVLVLRIASANQLSCLLIQEASVLRFL